MSRVSFLQNFALRLKRSSLGLSVVLLAGASFAACSEDEADGEPPENMGGASAGSRNVAPAAGGSETGIGGEDMAVEPPAWVEPTKLSETGLYEADMETLAEGVRPFRPRFQLWSDSATKKRWILLPAGQRIDTSDMNFWEYPVGTKLFKEFSRDGTRVETRLLEKLENGGWFMMAYVWRDDQSDADASPEGEIDAVSTLHDVPGKTICTTCHARMKDKVLGFTAIQLSRDAGFGGAGPQDELDLEQLITDDLISDQPSGSLDLPGEDGAQEALGYLHVNCGTCHNTTSSVQARVDMNLWLDTAKLGTVEETPTYLTTVGVSATVPEDAPPGSTSRIVAGSAATSNLYLRLNSRGEFYSMPPVGSEDVDVDGAKVLEDFINNL